MKLPEKIVAVRKAYGITQEELAEICNVSRQAITKWETGITMPGMEKLLLLSEKFQVSLDVLIKDELGLNEIKEIHSCGKQVELLSIGLHCFLQAI